MRIGQKLILGYLTVATLAGIVGWIGLTASERIVESFEGGEERLRPVVMEATNVTINVKAAETYLMYFLSLHDEKYKEKFFKQYESLNENIRLLDGIAKLPESRALLSKIKTRVDEFRHSAAILIEMHNKEAPSSGRFEAERHKSIKAFHEISRNIRKDGEKLAYLATAFLNKQDAITSATEIVSYAKRAENHLILFLMLNDKADKRKFFKRHESLRENIRHLYEILNPPKGRAILNEIKTRADDLLSAGRFLIGAYETDMAVAGKFEMSKHRELMKRISAATSALLKGGSELVKLNVNLELEMKAKAVRDAASVQRNIFIVLIAGIAIAILLGLFLSRTITSPIEKLTDAAEAIGKGDLDKRIDIKTKDEIGALASAFNKMTEDLQKTTVSRNYMDNVIRSMTDSLIVVTPDGIIQKANQATLDILGYREDELIGKHIGMIFEEEEEEEEEEASLFNHKGISDLIKKNFVSGIEKRYLSKNGKEIPVLFSGSVMRDGGGGLQGIVCVAVDISARHETEKKLRSSMEQLKRFSDLAVGREARMVEMKSEVNALLKELGHKEKYVVDSLKYNSSGSRKNEPTL